MAEEGIGLVYGGGGDGLMGRVARATLAAGGYVTGIIPSFLVRKEHALTAAQEMLVVEDMHERKQAMFDRADAFVALPGGIGTLEELVEQMTWAQLERHAKPILIADINGFWRPLLAPLRPYERRRLHPSRLRAALPRGGEDRGRGADAARRGASEARPRTAGQPRSCAICEARELFHRAAAGATGLGRLPSYLPSSGLAPGDRKGAIPLKEISRMRRLTWPAALACGALYGLIAAGAVSADTASPGAKSLAPAAPAAAAAEAKR